MLDAFVRAEGEPESVARAGSRRSTPRSSRCSPRRRSGIELDAEHERDPARPRPALRPALAELGVHVYLQFDGFDEATQTRSAASR